MASSEFDLGTYCSVLNILNHRLSKVVLYLIFVVLMMRRGWEEKSGAYAATGGAE
jgi:hypothetical protein